MPTRKKGTKHIIVRISENQESFFSTVLKPLPQIPLPYLKGNPEFSIKVFRQLLSNEKARILHVLKAKKPKSIYSLAKELKRDFKAVRQDLKLLEQFGFVRLIPEQDRKTRKKKLRPILNLDKLHVSIEI